MEGFVQRADLRHQCRCAVALLRAGAAEPFPEAAVVQVHRGQRCRVAGHMGAECLHPRQVLGGGKQHGQIFCHHGLHLGPTGIGLPVAHPAGQVFGRHGPGNGVALGMFAAQAHQHAAVCSGFHPFGHDVALESRSQPQHALQNGQVVGIVEHVADEALVNLQFLRGQALQVGE